MMNDLLQLVQLQQQPASVVTAAAAVAASSPSKAAGGQDALLSSGRWAPAAGAGVGANVMVL